MDNLDEALGKLLNDPNAMAQVMSLAKSLGAPTQEPSAPAQDSKELGNLLSKAGEGRHTALFRALEPYLSPQRRQKLEKAMQLARLSSLAGYAMQSPDREP